MSGNAVGKAAVDNNNKIHIAPPESPAKKSGLVDTRAPRTPESTRSIAMGSPERRTIGSPRLIRSVIRGGELDSEGELAEAAYSSAA